MAGSLPRKAVGAGQSASQARPPYPTSPKSAPTDTDDTEPIPLKLSAGQHSRTSSISSHNTWDTGSEGDDDSDKLRAESPEHQDLRLADASLIPHSLRPGRPVGGHFDQSTGPVHDLDSQSAWGSQRPQEPSQPATSASNNPFLNSSNYVPGSDMASMNKPNWDDLADLGRPPEEHKSHNSTNGPPIAELDSLLLEEKNLPHDQLLPSNIASQTPPPEPPPVPSFVQPQPSGAASNNPWREDLDRQPSVTNHQPALLVDLGADTAAGEWSSQPRSTPISPVPPKLASISSPVSQAKLEAQRHALYSIKQINWLSDASSGMRRSPILTQNANGPCPLLALVNALILSTPVTEITALHEALQSREQITLGLLLDVVFEELVRRNEQYGRELPDIDDLYSFLINLHTGLNVNPRFVASDHSTDTVGMYDTSPGSFEQTPDMKLYGTFRLPLVHGWMIPFGSEDYKAFERTAQTYDDAQNVQFREEELEEKAGSSGLDEQEQQMAQDILVIKRVMASYPSQLTEYGLAIISKWMRPGQIGILFRNDHFSTLYKEPRTGVLMSLVTDAGYASHDEIIWESLVDITGAHSEFFSGDFRAVGPTSAGRPTDPIGPLATLDDDGHDRAVTEQQDHDLALALQLQEEENERGDPGAAERHRREEELSRRFLEQESNVIPSQAPLQSQQQPQPQLPPRRTDGVIAAPVAPSTAPVINAPAARHDADEVAPPPSYEQAASDRPYRDGDARNALPPQQGDALGALNALSAQHQAQQQRIRPGIAPVAAGQWRPGSNQMQATQRPGQYWGAGPAHPGPYAAAAAAQGPYGRPINDQEKCTVM